MKKIAFLLIAGVLCMSTLPVYAASASAVKSSTKVSGASPADYPQIPSSETLQKDVGFVPKAPQRLAGDFIFESGNLTESYDLDLAGNPVNRKKGVQFRYATFGNGARSVTLSAEPVSGETGLENQTGLKYGEVSLYFSDTYANSLSWTEGGIQYILMDTDRAVTKEELVDMAKGMLDLGTE